jgi:hypothetical protein
MRVYFIKDYQDGDITHRKGQNATLWDATTAIKGKYAVPYEEKDFADEPQNESKTANESADDDKAIESKTVKTKKKQYN